MKRCVSLRNLFENGIPCLEFGGTIKFHGESDNDYDLINDTTQEVIIRNDEQLEFGEWCHDEIDGKFIVGTSDSGKKVYFSKEEYELAVSEKRTIELGKEYLFAGYRWVPVEINENCHVAVMQSLGVTAGPWPGFSMENLGNGNHYTHNIDEYDISKYDDKTYALMKQIKPVSLIDGLYLPGFEDINDNQLWKDALARAASHYRSFGASGSYAWTGTYYGNSHNAYNVNSNGNIYDGDQSNSFVVPAAFNLDLSKIEIEGNEIKVQVTKASGNSEISAQSLINKLRKQAENSQKLLNLAADTIETYERASAYIHGRFFEGFPVHRQGDDESDSIECPMCKHEVARNDDYPDERPHHCQNCGTKLIY